MTVGAGRVPAAAPPPRGRGARSRRPRRRRTILRLQNRVEYLAVRGVVGFLAALPLGLAFRVGEAVMLLVYWVAVPIRRVGLTNLAMAFPDRSLAERKRILRASVLNLGRMVAELAHLPHTSDEQLRDMVRFEDETWSREAIGWERPTGVLSWAATSATGSCWSMPTAVAAIRSPWCIVRCGTRSSTGG